MKRRVFVVDDDRDHAESIADILEMRGYAVEIAVSGEDAIERFATGGFDVTLMDVKLPGMNGVETFFEFRRLNPEAQVIMMTGYSVEQLLAQAVEGGAAGVLHKPFVVADLLRALERAKPRGLVLVADDDPSFADSTAGLLAAEGYAVKVARDGREALDALLIDRIDCLILDLRLPVLSGIEVYRQLQRAGRMAPTILVTGYAGEEASALERVQRERLLIKPFDPAVLLAAVHSVMEPCRDVGER
jgi:two-component system response regulator HydG